MKRNSMPFLERLTTESGYLLQVLLALVLGFFIGLERKIRYKEAGIRTHAIDCAGAALITIVGKFGFGDAGQYDGSRVAAQIVSGIGFLGAGIIMYRRDKLRGITTAAGVWATAGIGMTAGAGLYILATGSTAFIIILQCVLHLRIRFFQTKRFYLYRIKFICEDNENETIKALFGVTGYNRINYSNENGGLCASAEIRTNCSLSDDEIKKIVVENDFITSVERICQLDGKDRDLILKTTKIKLQKKR